MSEAEVEAVDSKKTKLQICWDHVTSPPGVRRCLEHDSMTTRNVIVYTNALF